METNIKQSVLSVKEDLEKISLNSETITNLNKLTCDKLQEIEKIDLLDKDVLIKVWQVARYSECCITLNYCISQELENLKKSLKSINDKLNHLLEARENDNQE